MESFKQNISVLSTKVIEISGATSKGDEISLGIPSSGNFNGLVSGWTTSTKVTDAIDQLNKKIVDLTGGTVVKSVKVFNSTFDWNGPVGGYYYLNYLASVNNKGLYPNFIIEELISSSYYSVLPDSVNTNVSGDITLNVIESPDGRFAGRIIVL